MALLDKRVPNITVLTGDDMPEALAIMWELRRRGYRVMALSSFIAGYPTYWDYVRGENLKAFYRSCSDKAKQRHLDYFYRTIGPVAVRVGLTVGEEARAAAFRDRDWVSYSFPLIEAGMSREDCLMLCHSQGLYPVKSGCVHCPKQPGGSGV